MSCPCTQIFHIMMIYVVQFMSWSNRNIFYLKNLHLLIYFMQPSTSACEILLIVLDKVYDEYPNIREFINTTMTDICRKENVSPRQGFSILFSLLCFCFNRNLCFAVFYCHKPKIENDAFDYRFIT